MAVPVRATDLCRLSQCALEDESCLGIASDSRLIEIEDTKADAIQAEIDGNGVDGNGVRL